MKPRLTETEFDDGVKQLLPQMIAIARRLSINEDIAADAVGDALLRASRSFQSFRGESELSTWLIRIVIHSVRDAMSRESNRKRRLKTFQEEILSKTDSKDFAREDQPDSGLMTSELQTVIENSISRLPDRQREVFTLIIWQGMSPTEVAELLQITKQNVHANLFEARRQLKSWLANYIDVTHSGEKNDE
jgi:RNA polymerase sigma-70 factor, ECF subfamily